MNLQLIADLTKQLENIDYPDSSRIAKEIIKYVNSLSQTRNSLDLTHPEIKAVLSRLKAGEPWEYIRESAEFYGRKFKVTSDVLIPRIETESLIELALNELRENPQTDNIVEIGTGSGIIAITLALETGRNIIATDISKSAIQICQENINVHKVNRKITVLNTNLADGINFGKDNLIVANLPYIPTSEYQKLDKSVSEWEPKMALESGKDGTDHYIQLLDQLKQQEIFKNNKSTLLIELTQSNIPSLQNYVKVHGLQLETYNDTFDRVRFAKISH